VLARGVEDAALQQGNVAARQHVAARVHRVVIESAVGARRRGHA